MSLASVAVISFIGTVFWPASPEAATALAGAQHRSAPVLIGLVAAGAQSLSLGGLFLFGDQLRRRWRWFDRKCEQARARLGTARTAAWVAVSASLFGLPPVSVTSALLPGMAPRPRRLLPLMLTLRFARFTVLAWAGSLFNGRLPWPW